MAAILQSLGRTVIAGIVVLIVIIILAGVGTGRMISPDMAWSTFFMRWLHVLSAANQLGRRQDFRRLAVLIADELERVEVLTAEDLERLMTRDAEAAAA